MKEQATKRIIILDTDNGDLQGLISAFESAVGPGGIISTVTSEDELVETLQSKEPYDIAVMDYFIVLNYLAFSKPISGKLMTLRSRSVLESISDQIDTYLSFQKYYNNESVDINVEAFPRDVYLSVRSTSRIAFDFFFSTAKGMLTGNQSEEG